jgi:hypothetical protein
MKGKLHSEILFTLAREMIPFNTGFRKLHEMEN